MRICLVVPSITDFYFSPARMSALGARSVCRLLEAAHHTIRFFNFPAEVKKPRTQVLPQELNYLKPFLLNETGPVSFFTAYKRLGPLAAECANRVSALEPELVLISSFAFAYADDTLTFARELYQIAPSVPVAAGGAGPSVFPGKYLMGKGIDFVLSGEAEVNLLPFIDELQKRDPDFSSVPNLYTSDRNAIYASETRRITSSSDLDWVFCKERKSRGNITITSSITRGCPRSCSFCSNHLCHGKPFRKVAIQKIERKLSSVPQGELVHLNFEDDNLLADPDYAKKVLALIRSWNPEVSFSAENGLDAGFLNDDLLDELISIGFNKLNLSLGSIDAAILQDEKRSNFAARIAALCRQASERGIEAVTYFICGLQGDSPQSVRDNLVYLSDLETTIGISMYYPVPGLPGFEDLSRFLEIPSSICCGSSAYPWTGSLTTRQLVSSFRLARFINLTKNPAQAEIHRNLITKTIAEKRLHTWEKSGAKHERGRIAVPVPGMDDELVESVLKSCY
ncbi:MAG: radical SAM protein [Spirochaetales bacterium]|nr:radical SAM protein [Spirochaetales bacterium]